jgi:ketosteroid isomerase-like protein
MSEENVEIVRETYRAVNDGDRQALEGLADSAVEIEASGLPSGHLSFRGHEGMGAYIEHLRDAWGDSLRTEPEDFVEHGDHVLVMARTSARDRASGAVVSARGAHVFTIRAGKIVRFQTFGTPAEALQVVAQLE